jgi:peroxiredoxin Q/BCP
MPPLWYDGSIPKEVSAMLTQGQSAPDFTLPDDEGRPVSLAGFRGRKVVVYFYPKDNTPGCTKEACSFRDVFDDFLATGAVVLGISADDAKSHGAFRKRFNLPFHLLSDSDHKVAEAYGAWGEKTMYGKKVVGIIRSTFIVDENGMVARVFPRVKPEGHGEEVLKALQA